MARAPDDGNEARIRESWRRNARAWTDAVRGGGIRSRVAITDDAVVSAVLDAAAGNDSSVIDIGCGEGWLVRALAARGLDAFGVDATAELVERARSAGGRFLVASYAELGSRADIARANVAVCNFSLLGETSTREVFHALPRLLDPGGRIVVQTLHPNETAGDDSGDTPRADGWRDGSWRGFPDTFTDPAPWYYRTMEGWQRLFAEHHLTLLGVDEPLDPESGRPASIIFTAGID